MIMTVLTSNASNRVRFVNVTPISMQVLLIGEYAGLAMSILSILDKKYRVPVPSTLVLSRKH